VFSGLLLGCAFPPADCKLLVWVGLVPLLAALRKTSTRPAFWLGYVAGLVFFLLTLSPLVSAHSWTGWAAETPEQFTSRMSRQWVTLHGLHALFASWGGLSWGVWAAALQRLAPQGGGRWLIAAPCLWIVIPEWMRAATTFGFTWAVLGNATADLPPIRQLASLGGVYLLSGLVVLVNSAAVSLWLSRGQRRWWARPALWGLLPIATVAWGQMMLHRSLGAGTMLEAAVVQHAKSEYTTRDFTDIGLDRNYLPLVEQALSRHSRLVMLPESIVLGALSLDGTRSKAKPPEWQLTRTQWDEHMRRLLTGTPAVLILGVDTVERGLDYNTLIAWNAHGALGWYHKRQLVPFSEYQPLGWARTLLRGRSQYTPGHGTQLIQADGMPIGSFICQEVLLPSLMRQSVRAGATLLVTGGNDGVFEHPGVAIAHADAAQLRAVETGRYVVRAMKTGISAIIDPHGRELVRSRSAKPALLTAPISPLEQQTLFVWLGDWIVWLSILVVVGALLI